MNKTELINEIALLAKISKADAGRALSAITTTITNEVANGGGVQLINFGSFIVRDRATRTGRNPKTGAIIQIPASKFVAFKAGKQLKEIIKKEA